MSNGGDTQTPTTEGRRKFLAGGGTVALSATAVALLAGCDSVAATKDRLAKPRPGKDVETLNYALGLEHEAIAIYQIAAESGLIRNRQILATAILFQGHHKGHRDALAATVTKLGGAPVGPKSMAAYKRQVAGYNLKSQRDVLELAFKLEGIAANEYIKAIPVFADRELAKVAGRLVADETMHWTVYATVLRKPLPRQALSFGA